MNDHSITLITQSPISKVYAKVFLKTVKLAGPDDILKGSQIYDKIGEEKEVFLQYKSNNDVHKYIVTLTRQLTEKEAEKIVISWDQQFDEQDDFIIETSVPYTGDDQQCKECDDEEPVHIERQDIIEFHTRWAQSLAEHGWSYGIAYSKENKTHPMLLPWEQLPKSYKDKHLDILDNILRKTGA